MFFSPPLSLCICLFLSISLLPLSFSLTVSVSYLSPIPFLTSQIQNLIIARSATHSAAMGLIASRDFVDLITVRRYPDRGIVATSSRSVDRKDRPPVDGFVRGVNYHGGTFCSPVDG